MSVCSSQQLTKRKYFQPNRQKVKYYNRMHDFDSQDGNKQLINVSSPKNASQLQHQISFSKNISRIVVNHPLTEKKQIHKSQINGRKLFISVYGRQTRLDQIMQIKTNPINKDHNIIEKQENNSVNYAESIQYQTKQNCYRNEKSRFDRIMEIKISKPQVSSTLINYQPVVAIRNQNILCQKSLNHQNKGNQWIQSHLKRKTNQEKQEKQLRLWRQCERQRELNLKQKKINQQKEYKKQRRKEKQFENMINKQLIKIQKDRDIAKRKAEGFASYIYPSY